ncbi:MAG: DUF3179 domain-containing protein [Haloferacaceae archaeon]
MASRRSYLVGLSTAALAGLAGCSGVVGSGVDDAGGGTRTDGRSPTDETSPSDAPSGGAPPVADTPLYLGRSTAALRRNIMEGGPGKDGIPSVDSPSFLAADEADLPDGGPVFGVAFGDDVRAYPQSIVVWHEVVNDVVADIPVSVTYCPLTGTAMGFYRGETTFGVSGRLVNNNLVMYDRATDSRWQQVAATSIDGPHEGDSLREFDVTWTTWGAWRERHPGTRVLSTDTGYARDYTRDPYGDYNPRTGYYDRTDESTLFPKLTEDDRLPAKAVVVGARTAGGAVAFEKRLLRAERVVSGTVAGTPVVAVYDPALDDGDVYRTGGATVEPADDGRVRVDGEVHPAGELPLDPVLAFDAMWFAWVGFYPETGLHTK